MMQQLKTRALRTVASRLPVRSLHSSRPLLAFDDSGSRLQETPVNIVRLSLRGKRRRRRRSVVADGSGDVSVCV